MFRLESVTEKLSKREKQILEIISTDSLSVREIKLELDKIDEVSARTLNRDLKHLNSLDLVKFTGSGRSVVWSRS